MGLLDLLRKGTRMRVEKHVARDFFKDYSIDVNKLLNPEISYTLSNREYHGHFDLCLRDVKIDGRDAVEIRGKYTAMPKCSYKRQGIWMPGPKRTQRFRAVTFEIPEEHLLIRNY